MTVFIMFAIVCYLVIVVNHCDLPFVKMVAGEGIEPPSRAYETRELPLL